MLDPTTVSELTERELIARIRQQLQPAPTWLAVGIGDDAAVVEPERNRVEVLTVDAIVEGVHFDRAFTPPGAIGHRALAVNLSDLAAMGAAPRLALLSLALPLTLPCSDFDAIVGGFAKLAACHQLHVVGGNLTRSPGPLMVDATLVGTAKRRGVLTRGGARPGDEIYVTGTLGAAAAGFQILRSRSGSESASELGSGLGSESESGSEFKCVRRYLYPEPRVRTGVLLGRNRAATACMDLSDGLADGVRQIAEASGVGATVDPAALPIHSGARKWFASRGLDPVAEAVRTDDYELIFTVRPRWRGRLTAAVRAGVPLTRIGVCTPDREVRLGDRPMPAGYSHFR